MYNGCMYYVCIREYGSTLYVCIREYGSTLYVGLARAVSPTNTNSRLTLLLTRLQEALYEDVLYIASNLKSTITFLAFNS